MSEFSPRPLRVDARKNRAAIVGAAMKAFETDGVDASLDEIARSAGVGSATLYRHFPSREDLVFEAMRHGIDDLLVQAELSSAGNSPRAALQQWLLDLVWHLRIWHGLPESVVTALNKATSPVQLACAPLSARTALMLEQAQAAGEIRGSVTGDELFQLVTLLSWGVDQFGDDRQQAQRRIRLATVGIL